jgi:hypothetical protein
VERLQLLALPFSPQFSAPKWTPMNDANHCNHYLLVVEFVTPAQFGIWLAATKGSSR